MISYNILLFLIYIWHANCSQKDISYSKQEYEERTIDVPLDHFSYVTNKTFPMRYLINESFVDKKYKSPIFFYTGNEGDIEDFAKNSGFIWEIAPKFKALIVFAEHRYYGKSMPFGNLSFNSPDHFGYLTVEQALADYAYLLHNLTQGRMERPVIAFGGSYGGMLASWFRMKYPHYVAGALAASAPVWQFETLTPCSTFSRIVTAVFNTSYSTNCTVNIQRSWNVFKNYSSSDSGRSFLNKIFKFCKPLTQPGDITKFLDFLEDVYGNLAMANYPYPSEFLATLPAYPVRQFCLYLSKMHQDKDLIEAMQSAIQVYTNFTGSSKCLDYESDSSSFGGVAWDIQTCNEIVMPMCSLEDDSMFMKKKWNFDKYSDECYKRFALRPREDAILNQYGGKKIEATNIIFSNGLLDPWSGGGVLQTSNEGITVIIIPEGAHHIDLRSSNIKDPISVQMARAQEIKVIEQWIAAFELENNLA